MLRTNEIPQIAHAPQRSPNQPLSRQTKSKPSDNKIKNCLMALATTTGLSLAWSYFPEATTEICKLGWNALTADATCDLLNERYGPNHSYTQIALVCRSMNEQLNASSTLSNNISKLLFELNQTKKSLSTLKDTVNQISLSELHKQMDHLTKKINFLRKTH